MSQVPGLAGNEVVVGAALALILPLSAYALASSPRRRQNLSFACYWLLLLFSAALVTTAVMNLTLIGSSRFWMTAGAAGLIGILVTFSRGLGLWQQQGDTARARERPASTSPVPTWLRLGRSRRQPTPF
jgi:hypothetical protein